MGFKDAMHGIAQTAKDKALDQVQNLQEQRAQAAKEREKTKQDMQVQRDLAAQAKRDQKELEAQRARIFKATKTAGDVLVDSNNRLFKIRRASSKARPKDGLVKMSVKGIAAMSTLGATAALEYAMNPNRVYSYEDLISYELIEDDTQISSGGIGAALVGGTIFGAAGGIAGAVVGKKKGKGVVENMFLQISVNDIKMPSVIITFISKPTKKKSGAYRSALSAARETMACLDMIIHDVNQMKEAGAGVKVAETSMPEAPTDITAQLERLAGLYERGLLSDEEFASQKTRILGM